MTKDEIERQEFEAAAEEAGALPWGYLKRQRSGAGYSVQVYNYMWWGWRSCAKKENNYNFDEKALESARKIISLAYGQLPLGGSVQLQAQIQVEIIAAMQWAARESS